MIKFIAYNKLMNLQKILLIALVLSSLNFIQAQIPPGTIKINDSLFIDKSPVTNIMYIEYLSYKEILKRKGFASFDDFIKETKTLSFLISPLLLKKNYANNKYLIRKKYYDHKKFNKHPVLNITKEQAVNFCKWRSQMVNHLWIQRNILANKQTRVINYRLLQKSEFINAKYFFTHSKNIIQFNKDLLKIKSKDIPENMFSIFPINELTTNEKLLNKTSNSIFTGFRCICEFKK